MKIFSSGSCRLVTTINNGYDKVIPIHSMFYNFVGVNFLGKLHNTKQHIQFIKFIKDDIILPNDILSQFLTSYSNIGDCEDKSLLPLKKENIKRQFDECDWYIFEICSLKLYKNNGFEVQFELTNDQNYILQTEDELLEDLHTIRQLIPLNKNILFQVHFRPNIIYNNANKIIDKRELIFNVITKFCEKNENTFIYDPSFFIQTNHSVFDGETHFTPRGHIESFNYIYNNYITPFTKSIPNS
jgi:hypothetical protein